MVIGSSILGADAKAASRRRPDQKIRLFEARENHR